MSDSSPRPVELLVTLAILVAAGRISEAQFRNYFRRILIGHAPKVTEELFESNHISTRQYDAIMRAIKRDQKAEANRKRRDVFGAIDRMYGRRASPEAQGGLPSLGKRRP